MALSAEISFESNLSKQANALSGADVSAQTQIWLRWLSEMLPDCGWFVVLSATDSQLRARWPLGQNLPEGLPAIAAQAVKRVEPCQCPLPGADGAEVLAVPLASADSEKLVLLFDSQHLDIRKKQSTVHLALWASRWLGHSKQPAQLKPNAVEVGAVKTGALNAVSLSQKMIFDFDQHGSIDSVAMALVNHLAQMPGSIRVSTAEFTGSAIRLLAVSGLSKIDSRRASAQHLINAMQEVITANTTTTYLGDTPSSDFPAHHALHQSNKEGAIYGLIRRTTDGRNGVVLLIEQDESLTQAIDITALRSDLEPCMALLGLTHRTSRSPLRKLRDEVIGLVASVRENRFLDKHLLVFVCSVLAITALLLPVPHRVTVKAAIEASDRQVLVAPQEGYVLSSHARAGDTVQAGDLLATLDSRGLQLVADKWRGEQLKNQQEYAQALAGHDRIALSRLRADALRIEAELALAAQQLARSELRAPFDGVLLSGDLSQSLGSPVAEGDVLFELGSKDAYRLQMDVDEHDIAYIQQGQSAKIRMTALPGVTWEARLENVLPVAIVEQGESVFRVPAEIIGEAEALRPGMAGVGKISVGSRSLIWVITHAVTDRLRIWAWKLGLIQ